MNTGEELPHRPVGPGRFRLVSPVRWELWSQRWQVIGYVLAIDTAALGTSLAAFALLPVEPTDWWPFVVLLGCSALYNELSTSVERLHRSYGSARVELNSVWLFAAVLLLHPGLVAVLVASTYAHWWLRVHRHLVHRQTFSAAAVILSAHAAIGVLVLFDRDRTFPAMVGGGVATFAIILAACLVYFGIQTALVAGAIVLSTPKASMRNVLARPADNALEVVASLLGAIVAWALVDWPIMIAIVMAAALLLHRTLLIRQLKEAARTDPKTGLLNTAGWHELAGREIIRATRQGPQPAILIIDLDHFKRVNDQHGHLAGDEVLLAVAKTITREVRSYDLVGRFGGEEFLALLVAVDAAEVVQIAERIRRQIAHMVLPVPSHCGPVLFRGLTASIGIALYPHHGEMLEQLIRSADTALFAAKAAGRNQIQLANGSVRPGLLAPPSWTPDPSRTPGRSRLPGQSRIPGPPQVGPLPAPRPRVIPPRPPEMPGRVN